MLGAFVLFLTLEARGTGVWDPKAQSSTNVMAPSFKASPFPPAMKRGAWRVAMTRMGKH